MKVLHFHKLVYLSRYMEPKYRNIIDRVIKNNSYFAHHENVLLVMIHDCSSNICQLGLSRIMKAKSAFSKELRRFLLPSINLNASQYYDIVDLQNTPITESPAMKKICIASSKTTKTLLHPLISLLHASSGKGVKTRDWGILFSASRRKRRFHSWKQWRKENASRHWNKKRFQSPSLICNL